jgi:nicotinate-nucleotide pyrophosphorylase (carboxylating)
MARRSIPVAIFSPGEALDPVRRPATLWAVDPREDLRTLVAAALAEDAPAGDLTAQLVVPEDERCTAELRAKATGVIAGIEPAQAALDLAAEQDGLGPVLVHWRVEDGDRVKPGDVVAGIEGPARTILRAERVAINFLGHLSGVATLTRAFVDAAGSGVRILNTRKTIPGLRALQREAVVAGGGSLHRASLSDAVLIKDNHLRLAGGVSQAVGAARAGGLPVEVEVETIAELDEAVAAGADRILLDNPTPDLVHQAVERVGDPWRLEISGGVSLETVESLVAAGARVISVGRITHSAPSLDLSLEVTHADV